MKKMGSGLLALGIVIVLLLSGCSSNITYKVTEKETVSVQAEDTKETESTEEEEEVSEESEQVMKKQAINIEEIYQAAAGTIVSADQLEALPAEQLFYKEEISDVLFERIYGYSYKENCTVPKEELVYLRVLHKGFDGETHVGEIMVNREVADDILEIFSELYQAGYPIERMQLIDDYGADDGASMADNNSSAFNFRTISHTDTLSNHSYGKAVDINPLYNPYVKTINGELSCEPADGIEYMDRDKDFPYKIDHDDLCYKLFTERGFSWGGDWQHAKDYQHFEK